MLLWKRKVVWCQSNEEVSASRRIAFLLILPQTPTFARELGADIDDSDDCDDSDYVGGDGIGDGIGNGVGDGSANDVLKLCKN